MPVLVGRTESPEGQAAMAYGVEEARRRGEDVVVFDLDGGSSMTGEPQLDGVSVTHRQPDARGRDAAGDLLDVAEELSASVIVVGIRHRSPVGKFILGSNAQGILLGAAVPVIAVKAPRGD